MGRPLNSDSQTLWDLLDEFPPIVVRLTARRITAGKNVAGLSSAEIAIASGIPLSRIMDIANSISWDDITVSETRLFCSACNFDPTNSAHRKRQREYIRSCQKRHPNRPPNYLFRSPHWETEFLQLINRLRSRQGSLPVSANPSLRTSRSAA